MPACDALFVLRNRGGQSVAGGSRQAFSKRRVRSCMWLDPASNVFGVSVCLSVRHLYGDVHSTATAVIVCASQKL